MIRYLLTTMLFCSLTFFMIGCGAPRSERPQVKERLLNKWTEGKSFFTGELCEGLSESAGEGQWNGVIQVLKDPEFKAGLEKVESASLPSGYSGKQADKDAAIAKLKAMIEEANGSGDAKKIESLYSEFETAMKKLNVVE